MYVYVCTSVCVASICGRRNRVLEALMLELQVAVSYLTWLLRTQLSTSGTTS